MMEGSIHLDDVALTVWKGASAVDSIIVGGHFLTFRCFPVGVSITGVAGEVPVLFPHFFCYF